MSIAMSNSAPAPSDYFTSEQQFLETSTLLPKTTRTTTNVDFNVYFLKQPTRFLLKYGEHNPSNVQQHALLLYSLITPFRFFTSFLSHEACSTNANSLFHAAIKNYHKNIGTSLSSIYLTTLSEETTQRKHTHARYNFFSLKTIINISSC